MSYINTDFDNLNAGINILNITETETSLIPYEGTYSDKGKGYKQQYVAYADNLDVSHLIMDFCFIFKDGFTTSNLTYLSFNYEDVLEREQHTTTTDSDGNTVWLFENVDTWDYTALGDDYVYFNWNKGNEDFYYYVASNEAMDTKQPDDFDIVRFYADRPNIIFEAHRSSPTSNIIDITFNGTFYNGSLGIVNNEIQSIEVYHYDDLDNKVVDKLLVENVDYTINDNNIYSGILSAPSVISISTGILYNQKKNIWLQINTTANSEFFINLISKGIPVFNWEEGKLYVNGDLIVCDTDGANQVNVLKQYSTSEKMIGYWIDGKPLYRKVINFGGLPNATSKSVAHDILNLKRVVKMQGYAYSSQSGFDIPIPYTSNGYLISLRCDNTYVVITPMTDQTSFNECYITLEYTKTTD